MEHAMKSILDPTFRYTSSANTDLRKTFARVKREMRTQAKSQQKVASDSSKVAPIFGRERRIAS
jgi:tRNA C32,U32 (ribose-2'-O)-methylase TrmJ